MQSLIIPLRDEGLTTLRINYNWQTDDFRLEARREWDTDTDFSRYNKDFSYASILTDNSCLLNTEEVLALFKKYDLLEYLQSVVDLLRKGQHFGIDCYYNHKHDIRFMCNIHSWKIGLKNRQHATLSGGIRRHNPDEPEYDVIIDGLNLGRGSSFKAIAARVPYGGSKTTVIMKPLDLNNMEVMGFLAYCIDRSRTHTGPDMNFPAEMADVMQENFSMQYTGGAKDVLGPTGKPTAYGTYKTLKAAVEFVEGDGSLDGKSVAVMGLGSVGWNIADMLSKEKTKLFLADIDDKKIDMFIAQHPGHPIKKVSVDDILYVDADIISPSSIGGIFNEENIPKLKCKYIWAAANNQLKASSQDEEYALAKMLADRGILFQTEWFHNCAGLITGSMAYALGKKATYDRLIKYIDENLPKSTMKNLSQAKELGITPTENAYRNCEKIIYGGELYDFDYLDLFGENGTF